VAREERSRKHAELERADPSEASVESGASLALVRRRRIPDCYILDRSFRVVLVWRSGRGAEDLRDPERGLLIAPIDRLLRSLCYEASESESIVISPTGLLLRLVEFSGSAGEHYGLFVEPFQERDTVREAVRRYKITRREVDVLQMLLRGAATEEIAGSLHIAETTVQDHIKNIATKTGSRSRAEIVARVLGPG